MTYRQTRFIYQIVFFSLFCFLLGVATEGLMEMFLNMSFLAGLTTIISQHNLASGMMLGVVIAAATLFLGRFFCGWICPMGSCQHFATYLFKDDQKKIRYAKNAFTKYHLVKYIVLFVFLFSAFFGLVLSGWLDPISLITRFSVTVVIPLINMFTHHGVSQTVAFNVSLLTGIIFLAAFFLNTLQPRFWCRTVCPLGGLLSLFSLKPVFRMVRDEDTCIHCGLCREQCQGACEIDKDLISSQCLMCMNCIDICPVRAIEFKNAPPITKVENKPAPQLGMALTRRDFVYSVVFALTSLGVLRNFKNVLGRGFEKRIRPPGSLAEEDFLARCIRCGACMNVCPTNVIQPAKSEVDAEGLWTPILNMESGYCEYDCTLCSQVCPTGAIKPLTLEEKHEKNYGKIGIAYIDRGRCLPFSYGKTCLVCQEVCPVSPKAIYHQKQMFTTNDGKTIELLTPYVNSETCIGCGACQFNCPVQDLPAIRVTSIGEFRSPQRKLTL
ncbi:MAG: 4Fe-4S dicluster domain-containing protein [Phycisphaerae bacterium]